MAEHRSWVGGSWGGRSWGDQALLLGSKRTWLSVEDWRNLARSSSSCSSFSSSSDWLKTRVDLGGEGRGSEGGTGGGSTLSLDKLHSLSRVWARWRTSPNCCSCATWCCWPAQWAVGGSTRPHTCWGSAVGKRTKGICGAQEAGRRLEGGELLLLLDLGSRCESVMGPDAGAVKEGCTWD